MLSLSCQGDLVFEGDALFVSNEAVTTDDNNKGRGGAIYNARVGTITFNGQLTAIDNRSDVRNDTIFCAGPLFSHPLAHYALYLFLAPRGRVYGAGDILKPRFITSTPHSRISRG